MKNAHEFLNTWPPVHHAYGISSQHKLREEIKNTLADKQTAYVYDKKYDSFLIADARSIKELQLEKTDLPSVFLIEFSVINTEAQNALLKVLEEPAPNTYFFLFYPNFKQLLPTLQSRLELLNFDELNNESETGHALEVDTFLKASLDERFEMIKQYTDAKAGDDRLTKEQVRTFITNLEKKISDDKGKAKKLPVIYDAQRYIGKNGASVKMILDMVAVHL
jgi:DNA polymerase III delta prime subunit